MSRTYIGPFGRILPVIDNSDEDSSGTEPEGTEQQSSMTTYQLPPPPIPTRLDFGSDPRPGFSEPIKHDISSQSRRATEQQRQFFDEPRRTYYPQHGQLPSVSQLLTPGSRSSGSPPSLPGHQSPAGPEDRIYCVLSGSRPRVSEQPPQTAVVAYPGGYPSAHYQAPIQENPGVRRDGFTEGAATPQFAVPFTPTHDPNVNPYGTYPGPVHQLAYPPQPASLTAPVSYHQSPPSSYDYGLNPVPSSSTTPPNVVQSVKPLPRVVGEQDIPGEGPCWVYEDGSVCRKVIDGEVVNAQWGVTKAGKPRKRLAIACTTCRDKKIKCDPGDGKCLQCEKFGRECRFTTA